MRLEKSKTHGDMTWTVVRALKCRYDIQHVVAGGRFVHFRGFAFVVAFFCSGCYNNQNNNQQMFVPKHAN